MPLDLQRLDAALRMRRSTSRDRLTTRSRAESVQSQQAQAGRDLLRREDEPNRASKAQSPIHGRIHGGMSNPMSETPAATEIS